jgi:hypothetical protein
MAKYIILDVRSLFIIEYNQGTNLCNEIGYFEPDVQRMQEWLKYNCRHKARWNIKCDPFKMKFHPEDEDAMIAFKLTWM